MAPLLKFLEEVPEYRCDRKKKHALTEMIACLIAGYASGRTSVGRALEWCRHHITELRKYIALENGIASEATISRMLSGIDQELFSLVLSKWATEIINKYSGLHIIIDGKALRGAAEKIQDGRVPYILNALEAATQLALGQMAIPDKTNEISTIPSILEMLGMSGNTFTIDAIGTNHEIITQILDNNGHIVFQVKKNNPILYEEIMSAFETFRKENQLPDDEKSKAVLPFLKAYEIERSQEKNRERIEHRTMEVCQNSAFLESTNSAYKELIPRLGTIGCCTQIRVPIEKDKEGNNITVSKAEFLKNGSKRKPKPVRGDGIQDDIQCIGVLADEIMSAKEMAAFKRAHWKIENGLHHVLDDDFREDRSTATKGSVNLSLIRKFAYNILRIAILKEFEDKSPIAMMDYFCDCPETLMPYLFAEIESFN